MADQIGAPTRARVALPKAPLPPPLAANWFHFAQTNADVQLLIGYIDPASAAAVVRAARQSPSSVQELTPEATHRIMMSLSGFMHLREQVEQIFRGMVKSGVLDISSETKEKNA